jgi:hypothetical protein
MKLVREIKRELLPSDLPEEYSTAYSQEPTKSCVK